MKIEVECRLRNYIRNYLSLRSGKLLLLKKYRRGDAQSKTPLESGFQSKNYSEDDLVAYLAAGHGYGWLIGEDFLVVDVDVATPERPDKKGAESLERLSADLGIDFAPYLTVTSPSGGQHFYMRRPTGIDVHTTLAEYPDIDFLSGSRYVVAAGSRHWSGKGRYDFAKSFGGLQPC